MNQVSWRKALFIGALIAAPHLSAAETWELVWSDEFDEPSINTSNWNHEVNAWGGGNNELQYYTARPENSFIRDGKLVIRAVRENFTGPEGNRQYTSARLNTANKADFTYGRIEARIKVPSGQGLWPAFWMLPTDWEYGGWAASGEIDIMEYRGDLPNTLFGTIHYGGPWPNNTHTGTTIQTDTDLSQDFHTYAVEWEEGVIRWYFDGELYQTQTEWHSTAAPFPAPFDRRFHILLNVAVGGNFLPNPPPDADYFPQEMEVDWVRVYQRSSTVPEPQSFEINFNDSPTTGPTGGVIGCEWGYASPFFIGPVPTSFVPSIGGLAFDIAGDLTNLGNSYSYVAFFIRTHPDINTGLDFSAATHLQVDARINEGNNLDWRIRLEDSAGDPGLVYLNANVPLDSLTSTFQTLTIPVSEFTDSGNGVPVNMSLIRAITIFADGGPATQTAVLSPRLTIDNLRFVFPPSGIRGDANNDGIINVADVTAIYNMLSGIDPGPLPGDGDVNANGVVNETDAELLIDHIVNDTPLPLH